MKLNCWEFKKCGCENGGVNPMDIKHKNGRKFHRINFDGKANIKFIDDNYDCCHVKDLSLVGMFVKGIHFVCPPLHHPSSFLHVFRSIICRPNIVAIFMGT